jgi:flagellar protein FliO/FliZ
MVWANNASSSSEGWWVILRTLLILIVMSIILFGVLYFVKKMQMSLPGLSRHMKVIGGLMIGQKERLVIVEIGHEWLILGVTAHQIQVLHRIEKPDVDEDIHSAKQSFLSLLQQKMGQRSHDS